MSSNPVISIRLKRIRFGIYVNDYKTKSYGARLYELHNQYLAKSHEQTGEEGPFFTDSCRLTVETSLMIGTGTSKKAGWLGKYPGMLLVYVS